MYMLCNMFFILWIFFCYLVTESADRGFPITGPILKYSDTLEVARNKPTKQLTNAGLYYRPSYNAVDGNSFQVMTSSASSCTSSVSGDEPSWWAVDLGAIYDISHVIIFGRIDCCVDQLSNFDIEVIKPCRNKTNWFEDGAAELCYHQQALTTYLNASCYNRMIGQYVRIRLNDPNILSLCEVEVHGKFLRYLRSVTIPYTCGFQGHSYTGHNVTLSSAIVKSDIYCTYKCAFMKGCYVADFNKKTSNCTLLEKKTGSNFVANFDHNVYIIS